MKLNRKLCFKCKVEKAGQGEIFFNSDWKRGEIYCIVRGFNCTSVKHLGKILSDVEDNRRNRCPYLLEHMLESQK